MDPGVLGRGQAAVLRQLAWIELDDVVLRASAARRLRLRLITA
jgi:hypothetical protein